MQNQNPESIWFGESKVTPQEKTDNVIGVFDRVAARYDLMNDLMSGGIHRIWKDRFVRMIRPQAFKGGRPLHYLDVAGGTGDIAFRIRSKAGPGARVTLCDLNENMLSVGRNRAIDRGWLNDFHWVTGNAEALPVPDSSVDVYTIAFGLRNVTHIDTALAEAFRVLRPGGRFYCLEFSRVQPEGLNRLYALYSDMVIPRLGARVAQDEDSYRYLVESIRKFPSQQKLLCRLRDAGFKMAEYNNLSAGIAAVHRGVRP
jgi:demethylmenaquinone methyltransferase/2-methoxy-6-polyprenyl-1,4-benzoquinol methylase